VFRNLDPGLSIRVYIGRILHLYYPCHNEFAVRLDHEQLVPDFRDHEMPPGTLLARRQRFLYRAIFCIFFPLLFRHGVFASTITYGHVFYSFAKGGERIGCLRSLSMAGRCGHGHGVW